jgi:YbgC/YbaW family acyl-CoA thioester hydrolase
MDCGITTDCGKEKLMHHHWEITVRSYELDMHRHVNNAVYLNYFEAARMAFLNEIGFDYRRLLQLGYSLFVARIDIAYKAPALLNDQLTIVTRPYKRKKMSGVFRQTVLRDGEELCSADITWACVADDGRPVPLPEEFELPELQPDDGQVSV